MSTQFYTLEVKEIIKETGDTVSIKFDLADLFRHAFKYKAGQYLTLKLKINGEEVRRSYSISSSPNVDEELQISSKRIKGGKVSTYLYEKLAIGEKVEVMAPQGNFTLQTGNPLVFFAAGSGITPIISLMKEALHQGDRDVYLYYGNRTKDDIIFNAELEKMKKTYAGKLLVQHFLSSDGERIDSTRVQSIVEGMQTQKDTALYYICGPTEMIQNTEAKLQQLEIKQEQIKVEYFASPKTDKPKQDTVEAAAGPINEITVVLDDEEHKITLQDHETILEGAERIGIDPPFSCHSGVCTTCKALVESGEVEMENNFGLGQDEIDEGYALTCIGKPKSSGVKVNWDEA